MPDIKVFADRPHLIAVDGREVLIEADPELEGAFSAVLDEEQAQILERTAIDYKKQMKEDYPYRVVRPKADNPGGGVGDNKVA